MSRVEPAVKRAVMSLLKRGAIDTRQAAAIACVSRQAVEKWVAREGWDITARRDAYAVREFSRIMNMGRRPSRRESRDEADAAVVNFEWRGEGR